METNLEIIEKNCGNQPENQEFFIVGNDPNFVFENDPNFETLRLFDVEGNIINVNSWFECANYVNGGWSINYNSFSGDLFFFTLVTSLMGLYVALNILDEIKY
ncbi:hypothetical protein CM15mP35_06180 [bacterium]|nr:MAG: hypothetical protein CM15mP35_06180 [bacterium]